jgi:hypothetical protein
MLELYKRRFVECALLGFSGDEGGAWTRFFARANRRPSAGAALPVSPRRAISSPSVAAALLAADLAAAEQDSALATTQNNGAASGGSSEAATWTHTPAGFAQSSAVASASRSLPPPPPRASVNVPGKQVGTRVAGVVRVRAATPQGALGRLCEDIGDALAEACSLPLPDDELERAAKEREAVASASERVQRAKAARAALEEQLVAADAELLEAEKELRHVEIRAALHAAEMRERHGMQADGEELGAGDE